MQFEPCGGETPRWQSEIYSQVVKPTTGLTREFAVEHRRTQNTDASYRRRDAASYQDSDLHSKMVHGSSGPELAGSRA